MESYVLSRDTVLAMFIDLLTHDMEYPPPLKIKPVHGNMRYHLVQCDKCPHHCFI